LKLLNKLRENLSLKILSLVISLLLWFVVIFHQQTEVSALVPLHFDNLPQELVIANDPPAALSLRLVASKTLMNNILQRLRPYYIDLSNEGAGETVFQIDPDRINAPLGAKITRYSPASIVLQIERVLSRRLFVSANLTGNPAEGYKSARVEIEPELVEIVGAESEISDLTNLFTNPIDITGLDKDLERTVPLDLSNFHLRSISAEKVNITVRIVKKMEKLTFENVQIQIEEEEGVVARVRPAKVTITLFGPQIDLDNVTVESLNVRVKPSDYLDGTHSVNRLYLDMPPTVSLFERTPEEIRISVSR
jgi:YbbR-like protein